VKYSEPILNQKNGSIVRRVPRDWSRGIHSVNIVPRLNSPHCTYYHQIGHQINERPLIDDDVRQGFAKNFQNLNLKHARTNNHGHIESKDLYHERIIIPNRLKKKIWINNIMEMRA
jgi:hypothetical protein